MIITNIRSGGGNIKHIIYGDLCLDNGDLCIRGTLEDILDIIKEFGGPENAENHYKSLQ
jgi:hypothetical protein